MQQESYASPSTMTRESAAIIVRSFMNRVYAWMAVSLLVSAGTAAWAVTDMQLLLWVAQNMWLCLIGAFAVLLAMGFLSSRLSSSALGAMLLVFAAIEGLALGPAVAVAGSNALGTALACTAGTFAVMSIFGATTRINLQGFGRFFTMVLIGLIIAMLVNLFVQNSTMDLAISGIGVLLFSALTAYDTQKLNMIALSLEGEDRAKASIHGATQLYLDFLNLFLFILNLLRER
ncbi:MAG TPA: Bax inhibitor-1/YccA family protein [Candidatus Akkermansia intestinavium]|nr:Bax inhibitor-1/YccA family protein [Candidatus Akkermansia intestinavium]